MSWDQFSLGEVCELHYGKASKAYYDAPKEDGDARVFGTNGPIGWCAEALTEDSTIVIGRKGAYRGVHFSEGRSWTIDTAYYLTPKSPIADLKWLYYRLKLVDINSMNSGAAIPSTKREDFYSAKIRVPSGDTQAAIADIISAYDDLIENNQRRMALLEESVRLLYREWFVHLRFPGHEHVPISDGVPEGWEMRPLGGCAKFLSGGTPKKSRAEFWHGDIPWVSSGELTRPRICDAKLHISKEGVDAGSRIVPASTILAVVRGMSLAKEFRVSITSGAVAFNQDLKALVASEGVDPTFLFAALVERKNQIRDRATEASHGTKKMDTAVLSAVPILVPSQEWQQRFCEFVDPMNSQWDILNRQNQQLEVGRDVLLPRLMNGELAV